MTFEGYSFKGVSGFYDGSVMLGLPANIFGLG